MTRYRMKAAEVDAVQVTTDGSLGDPQPAWVRAVIDAGQVYWSGEYWTVETPSARARVRPASGVWIIRLAEGELEVLDDSEFGRRYEPLAVPP